METIEFDKQPIEKALEDWGAEISGINTLLGCCELLAGLAEEATELGEHDGNAPARTSERLVLRKKAQQHLLCFPSRRGLVLLQSHWPVGGHRGRDNALDERTRITTG